jgi:hypothetical protein
MNKLKNWLRFKLVEFLGIDRLTNILDKHIDNNDNTFRELRYLIKNLNNDVSHFQESVNILHKTVENVVSIGVDADVIPNDKSHSWAVVCIEGNYNVVKFVDLRGQYARDILHFLKQFESSRYVVDAPYKELICQDLFKF